MCPKKRIAVTGYGPFGSYEVNPSTVVIERLAKIDFASSGIELLTETIPVSYAAADQCSKRLCTEVKPDVCEFFQFIVHIGVSGQWEDCVELELQSFSHSYSLPDVDGKIPFQNCSSLEIESNKPCVLATVLDCKKIVDKLNGIHGELCLDTSDDPSRFLCAYIYYLSLKQYDGRALFIHIPPFNATVSTPESLTSVVADIIKEIAQHL